MKKREVLKVFKTYAKKDIYGKDGVLLLAKGQLITETTIEKLERIGVLDESSEDYQDVTQSLLISRSADKIKEKLNVKNDNLLLNATEILDTIIFESKAHAWSIFINVLSNYVDWVYSHSINVAIVSLMIAGQLNYNENELWNIGLGAFLHDVGMILIPKDIIQKPGPLDEQEMLTVQQHCDLGVSSVKSMELPQECIDIISQHHERLDGSGYPNALDADNISRNAKIVMVADVADALTSYRSYRKAHNISTAIKYLKSNHEEFPQDIVVLLEKLMV